MNLLKIRWVFPLPLRCDHNSSGNVSVEWIKIKGFRANFRQLFSFAKMCTVEDPRLNEDSVENKIAYIPTRLLTGCHFEGVI